MTEKRYYEKNYEESYYIFDSKTLSEKEFEKRVEYDGYDIFAYSLASKEVTDLLNENEELKKENEQLKQELKKYTDAFDCSQCRFQNYDWFDDGDEFEVCEKGNNEAQMENHSCSEWELI